MRHEPAYSSVPVIPALPPGLRDAIGDGVVWESVALGHSGTAIYRLTSATGETRYVKIAEWQATTGLVAETARLGWLSGRLPVPRVLHTASVDGRAFLHMSAIPGYVSCDPQVTGDKARVVRLLAEGLRIVHALDWSGCPFDARLDVQIAAARAHMAQGAVDESDFDAHRRGRTADSLFAELLATRPDAEDLVFTHGDYCLPNILIGAARDDISGFIDLGRAGVADRYQDIALAARSVAYNFGVEWVPFLFAHYGLTAVDHAKIAFYQLLDEFF